MFERMLPKQVTNEFGGHRAALWVLGLLVALNLVIALNSIFNTQSVAVGADGIPLDSYGPAAADKVLLLFALTALGHLFLALVALTVLVRYRALVPFIYLVMLGEQGARRVIVQSYAEPGLASSTIALVVNYGLLALMLAGLWLSLLRRRDPGQ